MASSAGLRWMTHIDLKFSPKLKVQQTKLIIDGRRAEFNGLFAASRIEYGQPICWYTKNTGDMCTMRDSVLMYDVICNDGWRSATGQAVIDGTPESVKEGVTFVSGKKKVGGYANSANNKRKNNSRLKDVTVLCNTENKKNMRFLILVCNASNGIEENGEILWDYSPSYKMMTPTA